jgi:hypothetical protein
VQDAAKEVGEDANDNDDFLTVREKSAEEVEQEDQAFRQWLLKNMKSDEKCRDTYKGWLAVQEQQGSVEKVDPNEAFLLK